MGVARPQPAESNVPQLAAARYCQHINLALPLLGKSALPRTDALRSHCPGKCPGVSAPRESSHGCSWESGLGGHAEGDARPYHTLVQPTTLLRPSRRSCMDQAPGGEASQGPGRSAGLSTEGIYCSDTQTAAVPGNALVHLCLPKNSHPFLPDAE